MVVDSEGYVNGYDPESAYKSKIELEYIQAEYIDYLNGTQVIILPSGVEDFTTIIFGGMMEETDESYSITYTLIEDDETIAVQTIENPIHENTEHSIPIIITEDQIEIGETIITELEIEAEIEPEPQPQPRGIPGFTIESITLGIVMTLVILWITKRRT